MSIYKQALAMAKQTGLKFETCKARISRAQRYEVYAPLKVAQDHRCAICRRLVPLCIDHDHKTDRVRGLLCGTCNSGLGMFADDVGRLQGAIEYLQKHSAKPIGSTPKHW